MDGLEATEVKLSAINRNKDFRYDSNFWATIIHKNKNLNYIKIGDILLSSQYGISIGMNEDRVGVPIYRMNEINKMLCINTVDKYANVALEEFEAFKLNNKDVLFNRTNSFEWVGRTGVFYKNSTEQFIFASYLVRFIPNSFYVLPEYLASFLSCKYGVKAIKSRSRQSINQTNVNPEEVKEIEIPILGLHTQRKIELCFEIANNNIVNAEAKYKEAEKLLLSHLGLNNYTTNPSGISIKPFSKSFGATGRLDSEYYQQKYEEIENHYSSNETISSVCNIFDTNFEPDITKKYKYIELSNIGKYGEIRDVETYNGSELPTRARRILKTGQVIVSSIEGSIESCALVTDEYDNSLCSTGFYVIDSNIINSETLFILFKSITIQTALIRRCSGTILTAINKNEFLSIPMPNIEKNIQSQISSRVKESFALRKKANELLELATKAVETAIEYDEDTAIKLLENNNAR